VLETEPDEEQKQAILETSRKILQR
jgi:hypothetical protein